MRIKRKGDLVKSQSILKYFSYNSAAVSLHENTNYGKQTIQSNQAVIEDESIIIDNLSMLSETSKFSDHSNITENHYSIKNFNKILTEIFQNQNDLNLFTKDEIDILEKFKLLNSNEKNILLKIYHKVYKWHRFDKVNTLNNEPFQKLYDNGFLRNDFCDMDLSSKLSILQTGELVLVLKKFNIKSKNKRKKEMIELLLNACNEKGQISHFFIVKSSNTFLHKIESELKSYLRFTFKMNAVVRMAFCKLIVLFTLTDGNFVNFRHLGEKNRNTLFFLLKIDLNEVSLPLYRLSRISNIFSDFKTLEKYIVTLEYLMEIRTLFDNKKYEEANKIFTEFASSFPSQSMVDCESEISSLPSFLRRFCPRSVIVDVYSIGVAILEKLKLYPEAVSLLKSLLAATKSYVGVSKRRGRWYLRLCIDLKCTKDREQYRLWLQQGLEDGTTPPSFMLDFKNRLDKMEASVIDIAAIDECVIDTTEDDVLEPCSLPDIDFKILRTIFIDATTHYRLDDAHRPEYCWQEGDTTLYCHVEDYVILHLIAQGGFTDGIHGETNTFIILYLLLFYDVIYADVPDVFYTYRQTVPLDLYSSAFKINRSKIIDDKFDYLRNKATNSDIIGLLLTNWNNHRNELGIVSDWRIIDNEQRLVDLFSSLGLEIVLAVCEKFIDNFSYWSSGMPDLLMWNRETKIHEIIEVKGPMDKLSEKQRLWIGQLQAMGASVTLCHVRGVSFKQR